jgi:lipoprotein-releasing system permease protein
MAGLKGAGLQGALSTQTLRVWPQGLPFEWVVALRFLRDGRLQTVFILMGVAIGVGVIVFMSAVLAGMQANFVRRVLSAQAHVQLLPPREATRPQRPQAPGEQTARWATPPQQRARAVDQWQAVASLARQWPGVREVSPVASGPALLSRGPVSRSVSLVGIDLARHRGIVDLAAKRVQGQIRLGSEDILIGTDLAAEFAVQVGERLVLATAQGSVVSFTLAGVFDLGSKPANLRSVFVSLHSAQSLLGLPGGVSLLDVAVQDVYAAEAVARGLAQATGVKAESWIETSAQFFTALSAQTTANTAIRFFVGLSVAFGIASVLVVSVVQKSREIGILRAMGVSRGQILRVFLLQGALLGLAGAWAGDGLGAAALYLWQGWVRNPDGTPLFVLELNPGVFFGAWLLASVTGLLAAVAPALRAARLDPVVAIRG